MSAVFRPLPCGPLAVRWEADPVVRDPVFDQTIDDILRRLGKTSLKE